MKSWKCLTALALGAATALGSGVVPASADKAHPVIGMTVYFMSSWVAWGQQGADAVAKANNVDLRWVSANQDVNTQISQIQQFINQKVDAIIIAAVNSSTLGPQIEAAKAAGIPVIATNMVIFGKEANDLVSYVGPDDVAAGETEAKYAIDAIGGKGGIVAMQGALGYSAEIDRTQGIKNMLAKHPEVKLLAMQPGNWDRPQSYNLMQDWLSRYGSDVKALVAENDDMAIGAGQALKDKGVSIAVTAIDGIKDGLRAVKNGTMTETNLQDAAIELGMAVQVAVDHLQGKEVPQKALLKMLEVTPANVDHYYDQLYVHPDDFIKGLPDLVRKNLASGDYSFQ